jgi:deazaflavin-dependent oxidoreductase (nitroreductase family)
MFFSNDRRNRAKPPIFFLAPDRQNDYHVYFDLFPFFVAHRQEGKHMPGSKTIYHRMKDFNARMAANYRRGFGPTQIVLLLTTTGRKSGLPRVTPLQYEEVDGAYYIAAARGQDADWFKNICANPNVRVQIRDREFGAVAEPVTDLLRIADFIELRLRRHPVMIRLIMHLFDRLPLRFNRADIEAFCKGKALAILRVNQPAAGRKGDLS